MGVNVYHNYKCHFGRRLEGIRDLVSVQNGLLCIDEMQSLLDSRAFGKNVDITQWLLLIRKFGLGLFYTTQHISFVDKRLREITDVLLVHQKGLKLSTKKTMIDMYRIGGLEVIKMRTARLEHYQWMYNLYDTKDIFVGLTLDGICSPFNFDEATNPRAADSVARRRAG
jgi:hypothetical protein